MWRRWWLFALGAALVVSGCAQPRRFVLYAPCTQDRECDSDMCNQGACTTSCVTSSDCGNLGWCEATICRPSKGCTGDACGSGDALGAPDTTGVGCSELPCRLVSPQCGCPAGQACYMPIDQPVCLPVGKVAADGLCQIDNDCQPGAGCVNPGSSGPTCLTMCDMTNPKACPSGYCIATGIGTLGACMSACDLVKQTGCGDRSCYALPQKNGPFVAMCGKLPGAKGAGQPCADTSQCAAGFGCVSKTCRHLCRLDTKEGCPLGTCSSATPAFVVGTVELGVCL